MAILMIYDLYVQNLESIVKIAFFNEYISEKKECIYSSL